MKKSFGFFGFGTGKKNLYLGFAFLLIVGLLSLLVFSGASEGFIDVVTTLDTSQVVALSSSQMTSLSTDQIAAISTFDKTKNATATNAKKTTDKASKDSSG